MKSQFPRTMDALSELCRNAGMGVAYDCCGDPLEGFGRHKRAGRVIENLNRRFAKLGVKRVVTVCPNCLRYLSGRIDCELVSIFDVFAELGVECAGQFGEGSLFVPCPDKKTHVLEQKLRDDRKDAGDVETRNWHGLVTPGLVNAHTHLQYTGMASVGQSTYPSFRDWELAFNKIYDSPERKPWREWAHEGARMMVEAFSSTHCFASSIELSFGAPCFCAKALSCSSVEHLVRIALAFSAAFARPCGLFVCIMFAPPATPSKSLRDMALISSLIILSSLFIAS